MVHREEVLHLQASRNLVQNEVKGCSRYAIISTQGIVEMNFLAMSALNVYHGLKLEMCRVSKVSKKMRCKQLHRLCSVWPHSQGKCKCSLVWHVWIDTLCMSMYVCMYVCIKYVSAFMCCSAFNLPYLLVCA